MVKREFFDDKIQEIAISNKYLQNFIDQIKKKIFLAIETIIFKDQPYNTLDSLQNALYRLYNSTENQLINERFLNDSL